MHRSLDDDDFRKGPGEGFFGDGDDEDDDNEGDGEPQPLSRPPLNMEQGIWHAPRGPRTRLVAWVILAGLAASIIAMLVLGVMALMKAD
jgi:hypothetical protein